MAAIQKEEFRDAARVNFRNRVEFARVFNTSDGSAITDATSLEAGDDVTVRIRASGVSGVTRLVLDFDGNLTTTITDTSVDDDGNLILAPLDTGDDVDFEIEASLVDIGSGGYTNNTLVQILFEGVTSDVEFVDAVLGDLIGTGRTIEDADLVVTPSRVESAIHNMDLNAIADVRDAINSPDTFLELNDVTETTYDGNGGMVVVVNEAGNGLEFGAGGDTSSLATAGFTYTATEDADGLSTLILTKDDDDNTEFGRYIQRSDGTVDFMVSGQFVAGGG